MKLPDFYSSPELDALRRRMGIPAGKYGNLESKGVRPTLDPDELAKLAGEGLDVDSLDHVEILPDGTLAYKDRRVLLYIRDWNSYGGRKDSEPKFHIAGCNVLSNMKRMKRFARYVIASKTDGEFEVIISDGYTKRRATRHLAVCQTCLAHLAFEGFSIEQPKQTRLQFVSSFGLDRFFEAYPLSLHSEVPDHFSDSAPENDYAPDFSPRSQKMRQDANWTCEGCRVRLAGPGEQRYLHVHHVDGSKWNDSPTNLRVLCIKCHASQPLHGHMKRLPDYIDFVRRLGPK